MYEKVLLISHFNDTLTHANYILNSKSRRIITVTITYSTIVINVKNRIMAKKATSPKVAKIASKILRDGRSSAASKKVAGSALSQRERKK